MNAGTILNAWNTAIPPARRAAGRQAPAKRQRGVWGRGRPSPAGARLAASCCLGCLLASSATISALAVETFTEPHQVVRAAAAEGGLVIALHVREGDRVTTGQPLADLDSEVLAAALALARLKADSVAAARAAEVENDLRRKRLESLNALRASGHARPEEVERAEADAAIAAARLAAAWEEQARARGEVKHIEAQLARRQVRSPLTGVVLRRLREPGEFVSPGQPEIMVLARLDKLRATFHVSTRAALGLRVGQTLPVRFPDDGREATAIVEFISPLTDAESGAVTVKTVLDNPAGELRAGTRCEAALD